MIVIKKCNLKTETLEYVDEYLLWNGSQANAAEQLWWQVNIGSGNGLVLSGNKPLPEPMLSQIYEQKKKKKLWTSFDPDLCRHMMSLGYIE